MSDVIKFVITLENLSNIMRFNQCNLINKQNVAEHSFYVCWWSFLIALYESGSKLEKINYDKLLIGALLHDLDESVTGDILYPTKNIFGEGKIGKIIKEFASSILEEGILKYLNDNKIVSAYLSSCWKTAKTDGIEGKIVCAADMLDCLFYSLKEIKTGNKSMAYIFYKAKGYLKEKYSEFKFVDIVLKELDGLEIKEEGNV